MTETPLEALRRWLGIYPLCPRCKLMDVEALDVECHCDFASRARAALTREEG